MVMTTHIIEVDGLIFKDGTTEFVEGFKEKLKTFEDGDNIIIITERSQDESKDLWMALQQKIPEDIMFTLVGGCSQPRYIYNHVRDKAIYHEADRPWKVD
jgi:hypothetical protein